MVGMAVRLGRSGHSLDTARQGSQDSLSQEICAVPVERSSPQATFDSCLVEDSTRCGIQEPEPTSHTYNTVQEMHIRKEDG